MNNPSDVRFRDVTRTLSVRQSHLPCAGVFRTMPGMDPAEILATLKRLGVTHDDIAEAIGRDRTAVTKMFSGARKMQTVEIKPLQDLVASTENARGELAAQASPVQQYVEVEVLPTFAGMGGGGTGEGDSLVAMLSRRLIQDELRGRAGDFLMIDVRGNSMEPDFCHGDQILIDKRDTNPVQPGPFALLYDDGYVVKNVERRAGRYRIFSSNKDFSEEEVDPSDDRLRILGRPVWFGRRV